MPLLVALDSDPKKHRQWKAFVNKSGVMSAPGFSGAIQIIDLLMRLPVSAAQNKTATGDLDSRPLQVHLICGVL